MVKHVESADEFNALKKASKPVRNPFLSFRSFFASNKTTTPGCVVFGGRCERIQTRSSRASIFEIGFFPNGGIFDDDR